VVLDELLLWRRGKVQNFVGLTARTGSATKARLNAQRKILALMLAIWRDGTEYRDELVTGQRAFTGA
jgi:hypothetical protein